jgi:hypothetical protein
MLKTGDKVRFLVKSMLGAFKIADIGFIVHIENNWVHIVNMNGIKPDSIVWQFSTRDLGTVFELVESKPNISAWKVTTVDTETVKRACNCDFRDLLMNGCKCGGI